MKLMKLTILILLLGIGFLTPKQTIAVTTDTTINPILVIGSEGSSNGKFDEPDSVYVDAEGNIYAGDTNNLRVQVFDENGKYLREFTGFTPKTVDPFNEVQGISELSTGEIIVVEKAGNLYKFKKDGTLLNKYNLGMPALKTDTQGLAIDMKTDLIYISNQPEHKIYILNSDGTHVSNFSTGALSTPENIVIDHNMGRIYVSLEAVPSIAVFDLNNQSLIKEFGNSDLVSGNYEGLALDPWGNILAVDENEGSLDPTRIVIFDRTNFSALYAWGGDTKGTAEGQFDSPDGITYDFKNDRVLIADQGNFRIQVFDYYNISVNLGLYSDSTAPIISTDGDQTVSVGDTLVLNWTLTEESPLLASYSVKLGASILKSGSFSNSMNVSQSVDTSSAGSFSYNMTATDKAGNTMEKISVITVEEISSNTSITSDTTTSVSEAPINITEGTTITTPLSGYVFFSSLIAIVYYRRKKTY